MNEWVGVNRTFLTWANRPGAVSLNSYVIQEKQIWEHLKCNEALQKVRFNYVSSITEPGNIHVEPIMQEVVQELVLQEAVIQVIPCYARGFN